MFYYNINTLNKYSNKIDALQDYSGLKFYFFDKEFSKIDWSIEPCKDLSILYKERAEYLRQNYEYIILAYSGGVDSTNILETFYYNDIKIDEILLVGAFSKDKYHGDDSNHNGDIYLNAFPTLKKLNLKDTKITIQDYTKHFDNIENFSILKDYQSDWYREIGSYYSVHQYWWRDLRKFIQTNDKKTAVIFGADKPFVKYDTNIKRYYISFFDHCFMQYGNYKIDLNFERVFFYNDCNTIDIMIKQAHLVKRFMELTSKEPLEQQMVGKLIYNLKNPLVFQSEKSKQNLLSARDAYLVNYTDSELYKIYSAGIQKLLTQLTSPTCWQPVESKRYYL